MKILNWEPKVKFKELARMMLASDLRDKMIEKGIISMNDELTDEEILDKGRGLAAGISKEKEKGKVENVLIGLEGLRGSLSAEIIDGVRDQLTGRSRDNSGLNTLQSDSRDGGSIFDRENGENKLE